MTAPLRDEADIELKPVFMPICHSTFMNMCTSMRLFWHFGSTAVAHGLAWSVNRMSMRATVLRHAHGHAYSHDRTIKDIVMALVLADIVMAYILMVVP